MQKYAERIAFFYYASDGRASNKKDYLNLIIVYTYEKYKMSK
ncbi:hypothetical protein EMIT019CA3_130015 [Bacillus pseudomycoides]|nr:hypothetical protein bmyco0002_10180 [Bacillus pseudomycoides]EEM12256.1 hypothetical protein bmyco0003_9760 [Bacillus pseudomycoides]